MNAPRMLTAASAVVAMLAAIMSLAAPAHADTTAHQVTPGMSIYQDLDGGTMRDTCTASYLVRDRTTGRVEMLTSGHCVRSDAASGLYYVNASDGREFALGSFIRHEYVLDSDGNTALDAALFTVNSNLPATGKIGNQYLLDQPIAYAPLAANFVGKKACKFGSKTGSGCGTITEVTKNTVTVSGPLVIEGDSGSPVYYVNQDGTASPIGILSNGNGTSSHTFRAVLIDPILDKWNLSLIAN